MRWNDKIMFHSQVECKWKTFIVLLHCYKPPDDMAFYSNVIQFQKCSSAFIHAYMSIHVDIITILENIIMLWIWFVNWSYDVSFRAN